MNNANLGPETTESDIIKGLEFTKELSDVTGLEVKFTAVRRDLINGNINEIKQILPIDPIKYGDWL